MGIKTEPVGCRGATIAIHGGGYFSFERPEQSPIRIRDIAVALSRICRFGGHCTEFYSVAQHSVLVSLIVPSEHAAAALLHDAAEAYMGDMVKPLKHLLGDAYGEIERRVEAAIFGRFGLSYPIPDAVKHADLRLLRTEKRDLTRHDSDLWTRLNEYEPLPERICPMEPAVARAMFEFRAAMLGLTDRPLTPAT
jgi:hypothetical protein